jgi:hypothetical protein
VTNTSGVATPLPKALSDWDYGTDLALTREIDVDQQGVLDDCRLAMSAALSVIVRWWPDTSLLKMPPTVVALPRVDGASLNTRISIALTIPGALAGGTARIQTALILTGGGTGEPWTATLPASELWSDEVTVQLEGKGPMFPMQVVDLGALGFDPAAPWALVTPDSLDAAAMGGVVLLLNERYPDVIDALLGEPSGVRAAVESSLWTDVGATLLDVALSRVDDLEEATYPEGTFGWVLTNQARGAFGESGLQRAAELRLGDPPAYRAQVNAYFGLLTRAAL